MEIREERKEREVRVFDLFISVLQRWRSLLICLIIGAVVLGAYGWLKSGSSSNAVEPVPTDVSWEDFLGPDEMNEVDQLYVAIQQYEALAAENASADFGKKLTNMEQLTAIQNNISFIRSRFSEEQKAYLAALQGDTSIVPGDESTYNHKENVKNEESKASGRHFSPKYLLIGAILGLILAAIIIIIKYIATSTIKTAQEAEENLNLQILARTPGSSKFYDKRKTGLDRWLRRVKQKNKQKLSEEENEELVAAKLRIAAEKQDLKQVCFVIDSNVDLERMQCRDFFTEIASKTGEAPKAVVLDNILGSPGALKKMAENDGAVIVFQTETTRFNDVQYERILCEGSGVVVLGTVIIE